MSTVPALAREFSLFHPQDKDEVNCAVLVVQCAALVVLLVDEGGTVRELDTGVLPPKIDTAGPEHEDEDRMAAIKAQLNTASMVAARSYLRQLRAMGTLTHRVWAQFGLEPFTERDQVEVVAYVAEHWDRITRLAQDLVDARGGVLIDPWIPPRTPQDAHLMDLDDEERP
jgi:hypothetical protein